MRRFVPTCLGDNIEKQASQLVYPEGVCHPHPQFADDVRLKVYTPLDGKNLIHPYLEELRNKLTPIAKLENKHWLDEVKVKDLDPAIFPCNPAPAFLEVLPLDDDDAILWNSCAHCIFAAAKRQMKMAPTPDPQVADEFLAYSQNIIEKEVGQELDHFAYSYAEWFNHNEVAKRKKLLQYEEFLKGNLPELTTREMEELTTLEYTGICKRELEPLDGKSRMVCSIPIRTKFVMGPVTWELERIMSQCFKGYCGGLNNKQLADKVNHYFDLGFTQVVQGDGSAFDNTQDISLKRVDHYLYDRVKAHVHHVPVDEFCLVAKQKYKTMRVQYRDYRTKKLKTLLKYDILGTVFSGDCDTTLTNTMRMVLYNRFVNDKAGLVYGRDYVAFSKGDDFFVLYKPYVSQNFIRNAYYTYFLKSADGVHATHTYGLGQVLKMLTFGGPSSLSFCSLRAWDIGGGHVYFTRDPKKLFTLSRYSRPMCAMNRVQQVAHLMDLAENLRITYPGVKIFNHFADALDYKAFALCLTNNDLDTIIYAKRMTAKLLARRIAKRDATQWTKPNESSAFCRLYQVRFRRNYIRLMVNYWETVKRLSEHNAVLDPDQLRLVNQQIDAEFFTMELRSRLGLDKCHVQSALKIINALRNA